MLVASVYAGPSEGQGKVQYALIRRLVANQNPPNKSRLPREEETGRMHCASETPAVSHQASAALVAFVKRQVTQADLDRASDRRAEFRQLLVKPVRVYPADENFSPVGLSQVMMTRDVTRRGLGLVYESPLQSNLILVRISLPGIEALLGARILWNRPVGPFYHIGCEIDARFDSIDAYIDGPQVALTACAPPAVK